MELIVRTVKCVLYPTPEQEILLKKFCGIARFTYNHCLAFKLKEYDRGYYTNIQECIDEIKDLKYSEDYEWMQEAPESLTKQAIKDLDTAFQNFYKGRTKFPQFKRKNKTKDSFYQRTDRLKVAKESITLTKIGKVKYKCTRKHLPYFEKSSNFINPRVSYDGKHWVLTFGVEMKPFNVTLTGEVLGIDLGLKTLAVLSNDTEHKGLRYETAYTKYDKRLKRYQRKLAHKFECNIKQGLDKYFETNHIKVMKSKIKLLHKKLSDIRNTYLDTISKQIVKTKPSVIVMEDLNIKGMLKLKHQARKVQEQSFHMFKLKIKHKCEMYGIQFMEVGRYYPSSKLCSKCGNIKKDLKLKDRVYNCECGLSICRDKNAALNLSNYGKLQITGS